MLLDAFASLSAPEPVHLLLIGDGPTADAARLQARGLGVEPRVHFVGRVPYSQVATHAAAGDLAVLPGVLDFGSSMKLVEYMALGKAVVAPDLQVTRDVARDGEEVRLFADGDQRALRAALEDLIADPGLRSRLGQAGARAARWQTWDARAETLVSALKRLGVIESRAGAPDDRRR